MAKIIGAEDLKRIAAGSNRREGTQRETAEARSLWAGTTRPEHIERWKKALLAEPAADGDYWSITGECFEDLDEL
jgi:hypothetical protein